MDVPKVVADIMSRNLVTLCEEDDLVLIEPTMEKFRFRHMPVVDGDKLVALVSQRDMLRVSAGTLGRARESLDNLLKTQYFVADIMTRDLTTIRADTPIVEAAQLMAQGKFGCLPVVEDDNTLVGIITEHDFVKLAITLLGGEVDENGDQA